MRTVDRLRRSPPAQASDLAHANSGRRPRNALASEAEARVACILSEELYKGLGPTMAQEALEATRGLRLSKETGRLLRPPKARLGELIQADGCLHGWIAASRCA